MTHPPPDIAALALAFGARADISARSVLVTIFGDSLVPGGGEIWLGDLIELCAPFGFNDRLVRTSMFRLAAEDWFEIHRVGRRSRYRLTRSAIDEFAAAEARIYHHHQTLWDGTWTVAFVDAVPLERDRRDALDTALAEAGFITIAGGVRALPRPGQHDTVTRLAQRVGHSGPIPVAACRFDDPAAVQAAGWLAEGYGLAAVAARYTSFLERHGWTASLAERSTTDAEDFLVRTMMVHDLRRARLADPDLPSELLPADWPADAAHRLARRTYRRVSPGAWRWVHTHSALTRHPTPPDERFS